MQVTVYAPPIMTTTSNSPLHPESLKCRLIEFETDPVWLTRYCVAVSPFDAALKNAPSCSVSGVENA